MEECYNRKHLLEYGDMCLGVIFIHEQGQHLAMQILSARRMIRKIPEALENLSVEQHINLYRSIYQYKRSNCFQ